MFIPTLASVIARLTLREGFSDVLFRVGGRRGVQGMLLALIYAGFARQRLPGGPLLRGMLYGALVFVVAQLVFMPLVGAGVFSRGQLDLIAGSLLGHLVYGGVTGWIYGSGAPVAGWRNARTAA